MKKNEGIPVNLEQMLDAREQRFEIQQKLLEEFNLPLISFTLNIAGPIKVFDLSKKTYFEGVKIIKNYCKASGIKIVNFTEVLENTGYEAFFSVDANALKVKKIMLEIEQNSSLGRLFDIDIIKIDGEKVSRVEFSVPERKCLLCDNDAFVCSRSRTHTVKDIIDVTTDRMNDYFMLKYADNIAQIATRSLLYEVATTPKVGLVDANNTGSHLDMDIHTFDKSAITLSPYFKQFVLEGMQTDDLDEIFLEIRKIGILAEISMLSATGGVNTHKGIIFSLGIVCASLGYLYNKPSENIRDTCKKMVKSLSKDFDGITKENATSHGEKVYVNYNIRGIRGEALDGFPCVFEISLPFFKECIKDGFSQNDASVATLLKIIANIDDTNIITRSDFETLQKMQKKIRGFLKNDKKPLEYIEFSQKLDEEFINLNISPGGSADLLALTLFMYFFEK